MKIIGLTGLAGCGKDTVAEMIKDSYGGKVKLYALADPLKQACSIAFGIPVENFYDIEKKEVVDPFWGITLREMLQKFGTEAMRNTFGVDFWTKRATHFIKYADKHDTDLLIITDIRFDNEAQWIEDQNGVLIFIDRDIPIEDKHGHASEQGVAVEPDYTIDNNGDLSDLRLAVSEII